jgi:hypothetical protein
MEPYLAGVVTTPISKPEIMREIKIPQLSQNISSAYYFQLIVWRNHGLLQI